jgi:hypothetical protein
MLQTRRRFLAVFLFCVVVVKPVLLNPVTESFPPELRWRALVGTRTGLYGLSLFNSTVPIWTGGEVRKILKTAERWYILSSAGIHTSVDLRRWESRNRGLPEKTLKVFRDGVKSLETVVQEIKDLEINPFDARIMAAATKDTVFLSRDGGGSWQSLGMPTYRTNGIKAVAVTYLPTGGSPASAGGRELVVFLSHSTYGIHYIQPERRGASWTELNAGIETLETTGNADEVADILCAALPGEAGVLPGSPGRMEPLVFVSQTFRPRVYQLDWARKRFTRLWSGAAAAAAGDSGTAEGRAVFGSTDSLALDAAFLRFVREGAVIEIPRPDRDAPLPAPHGLRGDRPRVREDIAALYGLLAARGEAPLCLGFWNQGEEAREFSSLSELWLLGAEGQDAAPQDATQRDAAQWNAAPRQAAGNREGIYLPANHAMEDQLLQRHLATIGERGLNMIVVDMKDDYGRFRFVPENPLLAERGRVFRPVDIDPFLALMKEKGIYTVARIVVFKDPELVRKENGRFAVWDRRLNKPWKGYYDVRARKDRDRSRDSDLATEVLPTDDPAYEMLRIYYDEQWVDPYSEEVWEYTALLAEELHRRGFDEIQFDYIRFPTDGQNLEDARYRWRESGMDMESAMLSFLRHIRSRLSCPISVDIYGANGWYRTGARTGQEVELMAPYVDVICPMYYPSHFEQDFLAQSPAEERPYRIYYLGTQRTARIGRGQVIVRPYVQAFYLNVAYDRRYYNTTYVLKEVRGVRDSGGGGLTYWNNSGRYNDVPLKDGSAAPETE